MSEQQKKDGGPAFPSPRQYAAIKLRVPTSGTDWLDEMIREARRMDWAGQAMQGLAAASNYDDTFRAMANDACFIARAMLSEKEREQEKGGE